MSVKVAALGFLLSTLFTQVIFAETFDDDDDTPSTRSEKIDSPKFKSVPEDEKKSVTGIPSQWRSSDTMTSIYKMRSQFGASQWDNWFKTTSACTAVHEGCHGVNAAMSKAGYQAVTVAGKGYTLLKETQTTRKSVVDWIPTWARKGRYTTYMKKADGGEPEAGTGRGSDGSVYPAKTTYLWDELSAYFTDATATLELVRQKISPDRQGGEQVVNQMTGPAELLLFVIPSLMAARKEMKAGSYPKSGYEEMRRVFAFYAKGTRALIDKAKRWSHLGSKEAGGLFHKLATATDSRTKKLQDFLKGEFGETWFNKTFRMNERTELATSAHRYDRIQHFDSHLR